MTNGISFNYVSMIEKLKTFQLNASFNWMFLILINRSGNFFHVLFGKISFSFGATVSKTHSEASKHDHVMKCRMD